MNEAVLGVPEHRARHQIRPLRGEIKTHAPAEGESDQNNLARERMRHLLRLQDVRLHAIPVSTGHLIPVEQHDVVAEFGDLTGNRGVMRRT